MAFVGWQGQSLIPQVPALEPSVSCHEGFQHVRYQSRRIYRFAIRLRMQGSIAVEVGFQSTRAGKGDLDILGLGEPGHLPGDAIEPSAESHLALFGRLWRQPGGDQSD